jgi:hypothetical protein
MRTVSEPVSFQRLRVHCKRGRTGTKFSRLVAGKKDYCIALKDRVVNLPVCDGGCTIIILDTVRFLRCV